MRPIPLRAASPAAAAAGRPATASAWPFRRTAAAFAHARRCRALPRPGEAEVARLVAAFLAGGGRVTVCPAAHLLPVNNGTGAAGRAAAASAALQGMLGVLLAAMPL